MPTQGNLLTESWVDVQKKIENKGREVYCVAYNSHLFFWSLISVYKISSCDNVKSGFKIALCYVLWIEKKQFL